MVGRYTAGAMNLPFFPLRSYFETDLPIANPLIRPIASPYGDETVYAVPPLPPGRRRSSTPSAPTAGGDTQVWGLLGCQKEAAFAADRVIVVVEELVDEAVIRADPNRTIIPGLIVDAVVVEPWGAHPSYVQGAYDRDNRFYLDWDPITPRRGAAPGVAPRVGLRPRRPGRVRREAGRRAGRVAPARARRRRAPSTTGATADGDGPLPRARRRPVAVAFYRGPMAIGFDRGRRRDADRRSLELDRAATSTCGWRESGVALPLDRCPTAGDAGVPAAGSGSSSRSTTSTRCVARLRDVGGDVPQRRRSSGPGGTQIIVDDPSATPIELFEAPRATRRASRKSEMMIVAAARELAGQRVCFVGVGLPNIAVNLAKRTVAPGPRARLRGGRLRGAAGAAAAVASATRRS